MCFCTYPKTVSNVTLGSKACKSYCVWQLITDIRIHDWIAIDKLEGLKYGETMIYTYEDNAQGEIDNPDFPELIWLWVHFSFVTYGVQE